jgi:hypothetical protein
LARPRLSYLSGSQIQKAASKWTTDRDTEPRVGYMAQDSSAEPKSTLLTRRFPRVPPHLQRRDRPLVANEQRCR